MNKLNALLMGAIMIAVVACGPSAEDVEKSRQDSIHRADSIAAVEAAAIAEQQRIQDSIDAAAAAAAADTLNADTTIAN